VEEQQMASKELVSVIFVLVISSVSSATTATFDELSLAAESYWNGADGSGGFSSGSAFFNNNYNSTYMSWDGFAYSNITDTSSSGWAAQYNAITGGGQDGSANYAIVYVGWAGPPVMTLNTAGVVEGLYVTNDNYAYYSMLNGDMYAKKFGGASGDEEDWFVLTITGIDADGIVTGSVDFYLADYRFDDNNQDYIVNTWEYVDLSGLGKVKSLEFDLSSSDEGGFGMNTPAYFAVDTIVPEPVLMVEIDIKPGSYPNTINLESHGLTPVAILSTAEFDAGSVDPVTVDLSGAAVAVRGRDKLMAHEEDVDGDGLVDLVVQVVTGDIDPGLLQQDGDVVYAVLTANTYDGQDFTGVDEISIVP
jgi:hypothetical protein